MCIQCFRSMCVCVCVCTVFMCTCVCVCTHVVSVCAGMPVHAHGCAGVCVQVCFCKLRLRYPQSRLRALPKGPWAATDMPGV